MIDIAGLTWYDSAMNVSPSPDPPLPSASEPPTERVPRWRWWIHLVLLASYVLGLGLAGLSRTSSGGLPMLSGTPHGLLVMAAVELIAFGTVFGLAWLASRVSKDELLLRWRGGFRMVSLAVTYSVGLRLLVVLVVIIISVGLILSGTVRPEALKEFLRANQPRTEALVDVSAVRSDTIYFLLLITVVSFVVAGLREELWRSGFFAGLRALGPRYFGSVPGQITASAIAAIVFGVGHLAMGWLAALMTGVLGFGLGVIMLFHRSIWPAVIAHGLFDATTFALLRWIEVGKLMAG
jgi:membrane protease YdiL (CAAX protease family)